MKRVNSCKRFWKDFEDKVVVCITKDHANLTYLKRLKADYVTIIQRKESRTVSVLLCSCCNLHFPAPPHPDDVAIQRDDDPDIEYPPEPFFCVIQPNGNNYSCNGVYCLRTEECKALASLVSCTDCSTRLHDFCTFHCDTCDGALCLLHDGDRLCLKCKNGRV